MRINGEQRMHFLGRERTELKVERVANREREGGEEEQECESMASRECTSWGGRRQN